MLELREYSLLYGLGEGGGEIIGGKFFLCFWGMFFLGGGHQSLRSNWGGGHESFSSGNVLTSLIFVIIEHENLELLNGYKFTGAFALLLTS